MLWSDQILDELKSHADPEADRIAERYQARHPDLDFRQLVMQVHKDMHDPVIGPELMAELPRPVLGPELSREDLLVQGQKVFQNYGLEMSLALYLGALPISYAILPAAEALARTSDLATNSMSRRVAETGQMMLAVMGMTGPAPLTPGTPGYATCRGVRLMHAMARAMINAEDDADGNGWDREKWGEPLSQEMMLGTILGFSYVSWIALERFGIDLDRTERDAHAYAWSVVAALLGVDEKYLPLTAADMDELAPLLWARHIEGSDAGRRLTNALLAEMQDLTPRRFKRVPSSMIRWLFKKEEGDLRLADIPDELDIAPGSRWAYAAFDIQRVVNRLLGPLRESKAGRWAFRYVARVVTTGYINRELEGRPPFEIPVDVAKAWKLKTEPGALARMQRRPEPLTSRVARRR